MENRKKKKKKYLDQQTYGTLKFFGCSIDVCYWTPRSDPDNLAFVQKI